MGWILDGRLGTGYFSAIDPLLTLKWCAVVFMAAAVFGLVDITCFQRMPHMPKAPQNGADLLKSLAQPLKNKPFLHFSGFVGMLTFANSFMGQFLTLYVIEKVKINSTGTQLMLLVAPMLAQLVVLPAWGAAADRMGKKPMLMIASLGLVPVALGWCMLRSGNPWIGYALSALGTALWTGVEVANFNYVMDVSGAERRGGSSYVAINTVIINVAGCLGGFASGLIAQKLKDWNWTPIACCKTFTFYDVLFIGGAMLRLGAVLIFSPLVRETNAKSTLATLRFLAANIAGGAAKLLTSGVRFLQTTLPARPAATPVRSFGLTEIAATLNRRTAAFSARRAV